MLKTAIKIRKKKRVLLSISLFDNLTNQYNPNDIIIDNVGTSALKKFMFFIESLLEM